MGKIALLTVSTLVLVLGQVQGWAPPYPDAAKNFESVHAMRKRLNITYGYMPRSFSPEMCRYITEEKCREADEATQEHARGIRDISEHQRRERRLQRGDYNPNKHNPNMGTFKVLVIPVLFTDHVGRQLISQDDIESLYVNLMGEWLDENSKGMYSIEPVVMDWMETDNTEQYYSFDEYGITDQLQAAFRPLMDELDTTFGGDWSEFDVDGNGKLDSVVFVHSGYGAESGRDDCYNGRIPQQRIWAHAWGSSNAWTSADGSIKLNGYSVHSAFDGWCDQVPAKMGLPAHEFMHTFNLIDTYDPDFSASEGLGSWDVMAYPYGPLNDPNLPGHLSAYSKANVGWVDVVLIEYDGLYTLGPAATSTIIYRINLGGFGLNLEYLLIENRQRIGYDIDQPGDGILIYHVDDALTENLEPGFPGQAGWPENGLHYHVAILQQDGNYDLEMDVNRGDATDLWLPGDSLTPGMGGTVYPNTDTYQFGDVMETGITVTVVEQLENGDMTFQVTGLGTQAPTVPAPTVPTAPVSAPVAPSNSVPTDGVPTDGVPTEGSTPVDPTDGTRNEAPTASPSQPSGAVKEQCWTTYAITGCTVYMLLVSMW